MAANTKTPAKTAAKKPQDHKKPESAAPINITGGREKVDVKLVGVTYEALPPKGIVALKFAQTAQEASKDPQKLINSLTDWLDMAFSEEDSEAILNRLYDNKDDLDISHVIELIQAMTEYVTGNPTT